MRWHRYQNARYFGIDGLKEAIQYLEHPVLGKYLVEISQVLMEVNGKTELQISGTPDDLKLRSSMTLFAALDNPHSVFSQVLKNTLVQSQISLHFPSYPETYKNL